jgi:small GTP-binding protein
MKIIQYKICLLGDFAVGKTSLVRQYVEGRFDDRYLSTIGVNVSRKSLDWNGSQYQLLIWDLAGGDKFFQYQNSYLSGALGAIIVADLTRHSTLEHLGDHVGQIRKANPGASIVFVGNKLDLANEREIEDEELKKVSELYQCRWILASAKTGNQVEDGFQELVAAIRGKQNQHGA